ncbi:MAG: DUF4304 domain-containing protein [Clostridia bacterium]|nr:DUF4304 domain-containing protein [Clostridia bacterium]
MSNNEIMKSYLKKLVIAPLLDDGFTGKYPHFRRTGEDHIELVSFQTNKWGGSFAVEVSCVFPDSTNKNYVEWDGLTIEQLTVWNTCERYRLKGMYGGWFYYRDLYSKHALGFGNDYLDVSEKQAFDFVPPKGYKLVQKFNDDTAVEICNVINRQLIDGFKWMRKFVKKNK